MSDPAQLLGPAIKTWLRADTDVRTAFGANAVRVFDGYPPANQPKPYVLLAGLDVEQDEADCLEAVQVPLSIDIWSLTNPSGFDEARRLGAAVQTALRRMQDGGDSPAFAIAGYRIVSVQFDRTQYLTDPSDGKTVHGIVQATLSVDPVD
jgi:hypothetical protein